MLSSKWVAPALIFFAGAVLGRVFGLKPLVRGAMAVATLGGPSGPASHGRRSIRTVSHRSARRRSPRRSRAA